MWLSGMNTPDHNTINRFRSDRLKDVLRQVFTQVVLLLSEQGVLNIKELYTDGTKIEANANRYTFVWGNAIKTSKERIKKQLDELWQYAQKVAAAELPDTDPTTFDKIDADKVEQTIDEINEALKDKPVSKEIKQKLTYAKKNWPSNLKKYERHEKILNGRSSYSKTDNGHLHAYERRSHAQRTIKTRLQFSNLYQQPIHCKLFPASNNRRHKYIAGTHRTL